MPPRISLKAARVNAGLTQREIAQKLGISEPTYNTWEKNPWNISGLYQRRLADVCKYPLDFIDFLPEILSKTQD